MKKLKKTLVLGIAAMSSVGLLGGAVASCGSTSPTPKTSVSPSDLAPAKEFTPTSDLTPATDINPYTLQTPVINTVDVSQFVAKSNFELVNVKGVLTLTPKENPFKGSAHFEYSVDGGTLIKEQPTFATTRRQADDYKINVVLINDNAKARIFTDGTQLGHFKVETVGQVTSDDLKTTNNKIERPVNKSAFFVDVATVGLRPNIKDIVPAGYEMQFTTTGFQGNSKGTGGAVLEGLIWDQWYARNPKTYTLETLPKEISINGHSKEGVPMRKEESHTILSVTLVKIDKDSDTLYANIGYTYDVAAHAE